jgi:hypothetical protein
MGALCKKNVEGLNYKGIRFCLAFWGGSGSIRGERHHLSMAQVSLAVHILAQDILFLVQLKEINWF